MMTVRFTHTLALMIAGHRATRDVSYWMLRVGRPFFVGMGLFILAIGLLAGRPLGDIIQRSWSLVVAFPLFWLFIVPMIPRWQIHRVWKSSPALQGEHSYNFTPAGIGVVTPVSHGEIGWPAIVRATETDDLVLFYAGKTLPYVIPKSAIPPAGGLAELRQIVTAAIGARAQWRE